MTNPCALVPDRKAAAIGMSHLDTGGQPESPGGGKGCGWGYRAEGIGGSFQSFHGNGLSATYESHKNGGLEVFEPTTIDGYPAVAAQQTKVQLQQGVCQLVIGVRDDTVYLVQMQANDYSKWHKKPCEGAEKFAGVAIKTMAEGK